MNRCIDCIEETVALVGRKIHRDCRLRGDSARDLDIQHHLAIIPACLGRIVSTVVN
jgi:hypothetical protein